MTDYFHRKKAGCCLVGTFTSYVSFFIFEKIGKNKILNRIFIFFITPKMKKMILVLAGAIIAGGAIFAIQSYASSQDTPLNESEINKLKSTYPKNNNRLTAEMWDSMLDLLARINNNIPDTSIW